MTAHSHLERRDRPVADLAEDVDGLPLGVRVARMPMTGAHWRSRKP